jgi:tetratricopeptide (TPR) repeat protein
MYLALAYDQRARGDLDLAGKGYSNALEHYQKFEVYSREASHLWSMAQSHAKIALAHAYLGNIEGARQNIQSVLTQAYAIREDELTLQTLLADAVCLVQEGNFIAAIELTTLLQRHPVSWNETKWHARAIQETASSHLTEDAVQLAFARGKLLDLDSLVTNVINQK